MASLERNERNDSLLAAWMVAADDPARDAELERVIVTHAQPVIASVLARLGRSGLRREDMDDIGSTVSLLLVRRLRALAQEEKGSGIERFEDYTARLTYNAAHDFFRRRFPERARLKHRLRYLLTHDARFALWTLDGTLACGLAAWKERGLEPASSLAVLDPLAAMRERRRPAEAVMAIFDYARRPLVFDELVRVAADLWGVSDRPAPERDERDDALAPRLDLQLERRQSLELLWREVRELRPAQRTALLLNLRDQEGGNALALLALGRVATLRELAAALDMPVAELAALWKSLPLDDHRIAARLHCSRQQVINLRRAARERLLRRMERYGSRS